MKVTHSITLLALFSISLFSFSPTYSQREKDIISSLELRNIGPAFMTGRISDIVKDPMDPSTWYVATASSNVWKTENNGTTWQPIFDNYGSYSTGCITLDPKNPNVIWIGTGENQSQRSAAWGDGIYKSEDGGKSFVNKGLRHSEHIGKILVDPTDSDVLIVAAQGPLWKEGGDRGIYRSEDGGDTWNCVLSVSEHTGASDLAFDPKNPDVIYASTYQRRRHVGILVAGGPESRIYKSTDNGRSWFKVEKGLPGGNLGRIGIAVSPQNPEVVYAHISGEEHKSGFYRSEDYGMSWKKTSDYSIVDPQYYGEIYCDPHRFDHVYVMDVFIHHTSDGGRNFTRLNSRFKHVDNHALLFDARDPNYLLVGSDGGIYESWDRGDSWKYHDNLPIMQFYRVGLDNDFPFYNVYGGTQDNSTLYGPSRTISRHGITNADWNLALGGDGFQARIDPEDPNIVYCQSQYAGIVRYDRRTGQRTELQPQVGPDEDPLRWHWDSPLIISPHNAKRLYYAAQKLFKSDDRGDSWISVSGDLSRAENRNQREVMGKMWPPEAVWKNVFTSPYGTIVSLSESPLQEGLIIAGTDDGQIQITEDGGLSWRLINEFPGVPDRSYVADVLASHHDEKLIYVVFNNHKEGDFAPYIVKSEDLGNSWTPVTSGIDAPHACWTIVEDHLNKNLLFAGTEFGLFATVNSGIQWYQMKGKIPTIPVRDLEIQERENDLVCATFGRGMWILDNYEPLRALASDESEETTLFEIKDIWSYIEKGDKGYSSKGVFGDDFFTSSNPPSGPVFNIYLKDKIQTLKEIRKEAEKNGIVTYPSHKTLSEEDFENAPSIYALIRDSDGNIVSRTQVKNKKGFQRVEGNLASTLYSEDGKIRRSGPRAITGSYTAQLFQVHSGNTEVISQPQSFTINYLPISEELPSRDYDSFNMSVARSMTEVMSLRDKIARKLNELERSKVEAMENGQVESIKKIEEQRKLITEIQNHVLGDQTRVRRFQYAHPGLLQRIRRIYGNMNNGWQITETHRTQYQKAKQELQQLTIRLSNLE